MAARLPFLRVQQPHRGDFGAAGPGEVTMQHLLAAVYLLAVFLAIYGPAAGQGLIADDYAWIVHGLSAVDGNAIDPFRHNVAAG